MSHVIGIDCGSTICKGVLICEDEIIAKKALPSGWNQRETALKIKEELLLSASLSDIEVPVGATGYGRKLIDFSQRSITEITCHARGAEFLRPGTKTVIDIGGQDAKVIEVNNGKVFNFQMNDKCAAGTGRFLEMAAAKLGVQVAEFDELFTEGKYHPVNSMCAVFAESEIITLLAEGECREAIVGGIIESIATKIAVLGGRIKIEEPIVLTGGLWFLCCLRKKLEEKYKLSIETNEAAGFTGAIGAALSL